MKNILFASLIFTFLVSCSSKSEQLGSSKEHKSFTNKEKTESEIEKRIADTDLQEKLKVMNSLYFTKEDGSSFEVKAFLDNNDAVLKVEEKFLDGKTGQYGTALFYVFNGKKYASKERFEDKIGGKPTFIERISFYDKNEKVVSTKIRKAFFEEDLDAQPFEMVDLYDCSILKAMNALNQEGEFETRFQGYIFNGNSSFLTVGESKPNGYISALMVQYNTTTTEKLRRNQEVSIGKKLNLEFQKVTDENGFEFQVLMSVKEAK
jgi:hypothetical protein